MYSMNPVRLKQEHLHLQHGHKQQSKTQLVEATIEKRQQCTVLPVTPKIMAANKHHWRNGFWMNMAQPQSIFVVTGDKMEIKQHISLDFPDLDASEADVTIKIKYGDFGVAKKEIADATGVINCNLELSMEGMGNFSGVVNEAGTMITIWGWTNSVEVTKWLSPDEVEKVKEAREHKDNPSYPSYVTHQPDKQGKIVWFSGPPGAGKSTTAQMMAKEKGYVYYEADCTMGFTNPFLDIHAKNVFQAQMASAPLKGYTREEVDEALKFSRVMRKFMTGQGEGLSFDSSAQEMLKNVCKDIQGQKKRLGGDFAVATVVFSKKSRDLCRKLCPEIVFILLTMTEECQKKRLAARHGEKLEGMDFLFKLSDEFEPLGEDEENAFNITITDEMTKEDVLNKALEIVSKI